MAPSPKSSERIPPVPPPADERAIEDWPGLQDRGGEEDAPLSPDGPVLMRNLGRQGHDTAQLDRPVASIARPGVEIHSELSASLLRYATTRWQEK